MRAQDEVLDKASATMQAQTSTIKARETALAKAQATIQAQEHTIAEWAEIAGVSENDIVELAAEFTSHGRNAAADIHRAPSQHTNGFYNNNAWYVVNLLIGNFDHKGGMIKASTYNRKGEKTGQPFYLAKMFGEHHFTAFGLDMLRTKTAYEKSTLFDGAAPH